MEDRKDLNKGTGLAVHANERISVPAFGEWDGKVGLPDYSVDFSRLREHRRQSKSRVSLGNEDELSRSTIDGEKSGESNKNNTQPKQDASFTVARKKSSKFFNCCGCIGS